MQITYLISDLYSDIQKEYIKLNKKTSHLKRWAKDLNRHFTEGDTQRASKHMKRCSASLVIAAAKLLQLCPTLCNPTRLLCPWDSPGKNTGVGCHSLLHRIFPIQGSNLHLLPWQTRSLPLSHQGSLDLYIVLCEKGKLE